ncbi:MAG TPA: IS1634 family transposase [Anaerolineales bacterium]
MPAPSVQESAEADYHEVDIASLELVRPRSVGVEHAGLAALSRLEIPRILESAGLNGVQRAAAMGSIIGRMAAPGSELATWGWLKERSALGELLEVDFEAMPLMRLYRVSDLLVRHREAIEAALFTRIQSLFALPATVTLYDLTNTYFEGEMAGNAKARRGRSKEKRSDCPLVTLGLVLDGSGFVRRSRMFEGSVAEASTLEGMLQGLEAPPGALVIMDAGIATEANIAWLLKHHYRYLVVSRERTRQFDASQAVETTTASEQTIRIQRVLSEDGSEVRLYCHSQERQEKETAMSARFIQRFEAGLTKLAEGLQKPRGEKRRDKLLQRIGRLQEKSHGIGRHYRIELTPDESGAKALALTWERVPVDGTQLSHPGVYCLRTNELSWDEATLWRTYTMLTDLEAVFRSLKSELGLRPVYHHKEERAEGHLFITVLAYQAVQVLRQQLKAHGIHESWSTLRQTLSVQQRVTATFKQRDGRTLHVRKATVAEANLKKLYDALDLSATPGGVQKLVN